MSVLIFFWERLEFVAAVSAEGEEDNIVCTLCKCICMCMYVWIVYNAHTCTHTHTHTIIPPPPLPPPTHTHIPGVSSSGAAASLASYALSTCVVFVCVYRGVGNCVCVYRGVRVQLCVYCVCAVCALCVRAPAQPLRNRTHALTPLVCTPPRVLHFYISYEKNWTHARTRLV